MLPGFRDPFQAILALQRAVESRHQSDWMGSGTAGNGGYPPINIFQKADGFVAILELPGIDKNELNIEVKENNVRISGKKNVEYDQQSSVHRRERLSGVFDRTISLPLQIDPEATRAEYRDGLLALLIPRASSEKPRSIKIG